MIIIVISVLWYFFANKKNKFNGGAYRFNILSNKESFKDIFGREIQLSPLLKTDYLNIYKAESIKSEIIKIYNKTFAHSKQKFMTTNILTQCLFKGAWTFRENYENIVENYRLELTDNISIKLEKGLGILFKYYFIMFRSDDIFNSYDLKEIVQELHPNYNNSVTLISGIIKSYNDNVPYLSIDENHTFVMRKIVRTLQMKYENILYDQFGVDPKYNFLTSSNPYLIVDNIFKIIVEKENRNDFKLKIIEITSNKEKLYSSIINNIVYNNEINSKIITKLKNNNFNGFNDIQKIIYEIYENYFLENYPQLKIEKENDDTKLNKILKLLCVRKYSDNESKNLETFLKNICKSDYIKITGINNYNSLMADLCRQYHYVFNNTENITDYLKFSTLLFVLFYDLNNFKKFANYDNIKRKFIKKRKKYLSNYEHILSMLKNSDKSEYLMLIASNKYCNAIMDLTNKIIAIGILDKTDFNNIVFLSEMRHNRTINENRAFFKDFDKTEILQRPGLLSNPIDTRHIEYHSTFEYRNNLKMITYYNIDDRYFGFNLRFSLSDDETYNLINWPTFDYKNYANLYDEYKKNSIPNGNKKIVDSISVMTLIMTLTEIIGNIIEPEVFENQENYDLENKLKIYEKYISNDFKLNSNDDYSLLYSICPNVFYKYMNLPNLIGVLTKILFISDHLLLNSKSCIKNKYFITILEQFRKIMYELFNLYLTEPKKMEQWPDIDFEEKINDDDLITILTEFFKQDKVSNETVNLFSKIIDYNEKPYYYLLIIYIMYYCSLLVLSETNFKSVNSSIKNYIYDQLENYYYKRDLVVVDDLDSYLEILIETIKKEYAICLQSKFDNFDDLTNYFINSVSYLFKDCNLNATVMGFLCNFSITIVTLKMDVIGLYKMMKYPFLLEHTNDLNSKVDSLGKTLYIFFGGNYHGENYYKILYKFYKFEN